MDTQLHLGQLIQGPFLRVTWWLRLLAWALALAFTRSLPAAGLALTHAASTPALRLATLLWVFGAVGLAWQVEPSYLACAPYLVAGLVYFAGVAALAYAMAGWSARMTRSACFALCAILSLFIPCLVAPVTEANVVRLLGFELMLSMYSYVVDGRRHTRPSRPADAFFFLLVNPVLVYPERGRELRTPRLRGEGVARVGLGVLQLAASAAMAQLYFLEDWPTQTRIPDSLLMFVTQGGALVLLHSGAAGVQIGWMRLLGWEVPERYVWPLLSASPADFWSRWNTYVGSWMRRYVFAQLALRWRRQSVGGSARRTTAAALVSTFFVGGCLHDFANYPAQLALSLEWTLAFTSAGILLLVWKAVDIAWQKATGASGAHPSAANFGSRIVLHALTIAYLFMIGRTLRNASELLGLSAMGL